MRIYLKQNANDSEKIDILTPWLYEQNKRHLWASVSNNMLVCDPDGDFYLKALREGKEVEMDFEFRRVMPC